MAQKKTKAALSSIDFINETMSSLFSSSRFN